MQKGMTQTSLKVVVANDNNNEMKAPVLTDRKVFSNYEQSFLQEPFHASTDMLMLDDAIVKNLSDTFWLPTRLIDFLIKHSIHPSMERNIVIPTSALENVIDSLFLKAKNEESWFEEKKKKYEKYSLKPFEVIICTCTHGHYFVISLTIDPTVPIGGKVFQNVKIYDSLKHVNTKTIFTRYHNKCPATDFLRKFQKFMLHFVLFNTPFAEELTKNETYILEKYV